MSLISFWRKCVSYIFPVRPLKDCSVLMAFGSKLKIMCADVAMNCDILCAPAKQK